MVGGCSTIKDRRHIMGHIMVLLLCRKEEKEMDDVMKLSDEVVRESDDDS